MNNTIILLPFFILPFCRLNAQVNEPSDFIPKGFIEFERYFGDLNKDGDTDCVLIIKKTDSSNIVVNRFDEIVDRNRRGIIVLFKTNNGYTLADQNYDCFSSENEDGGVYFPPELGIEFERGNLIIQYGHGRYGYWRYIFRFQHSNFELIGYDQTNGGVVISSETSINFLTKKKLIRENINENDEGGQEQFKETWSKINIGSLLKLAEINDFDSLEMYQY